MVDIMKKEVKVTFETITPLWTGGAWGECKEIKPSSLLGSLRFWFELICYFSGVCNENDFNFSLGRFEKEVNRKNLKEFILKEFIKNNGNEINRILNYLYNIQEIPIPAIIFGTTNWRSLIEIKNNDCPNRSNSSYSVFYLSHPYFYGKFEVIFRVEETILESIFYPLLNFMDKYGFWGGKWNIGYGRLKILKVEESGSEKTDWKGEKFNFSLFKDKDKNTLKIEKIEFENLREFVNLNDFIDKSKNKEKKILIFEKMKDRDIKNLIKELLKEKIIMRKEISDKKLKHYIFGKTGKIGGEDLPQGSKILPFIWKENDTYKGGFISIAGILKLYYGE